MQVRVSLIASLLSVCFLLFVSWFLWHKWEEEKLQSSNYFIKKLAHTSSSPHRLTASFLKKTLQLHEQQYLKDFSVEQATEILLRLPFVQKAVVKKAYPDTLFLDIALRKPIAYVEDWESVAIDRQGCLFSTDRFYSPKQLPLIFLGQNDRPLYLEQPIFLDQKELKIISCLLHHLKDIERIDLSRLHADKAYQRLILVTLKTPHMHLLVLPPFAIERKLRQYLSLNNKGLITGSIVNLCLKDCAFIKETK